MKDWRELMDERPSRIDLPNRNKWNRRHRCRREGKMNARRWKELLAIAMIGEGVVGSIFPEEHLGLWHTGPSMLNLLLRRMERRPNLVRMLAVLEAAAGLWLARRQFDHQSSGMHCVRQLGETINDLAPEEWRRSNMPTAAR